MLLRRVRSITIPPWVWTALQVVREKLTGFYLRAMAWGVALFERPVVGSYTRGQRLSPLMLRIMAVNVLALGILVASILYLASYQDRLIEVEVEALKSEARIFASAIAESATLMRSDEVTQMVRPLARQMVRRLDEVTDARTRLYDNEARLVADSWLIGRERRASVMRVDLKKLDEPNWAYTQLTNVINIALPERENLPFYIEDDATLPVVREEVMAALGGNAGAQVWKMRDGRLLFSVAVPVQSYRSVLGAINLTRDSARMTEAIANVRGDIIRLFIGSLIVTIILSLYLSGAIARPIRQLAVAADRVRSGQMGRGVGKTGRRAEIPDFTRRNDEIGDLSASLRAMTEALWRRMDAIETFAADVAHEIKNPLASLRSAVETLGRVKDDTQREKLMKVLQHDVQRLDRLITDISWASRLDAELSRAESLPVDVVELIRSLVSYTCNATDANCNVVFDAPPAPVKVLGFEGRLVQVFQNLIGNAMSFSPPGGLVRITLMLADDRVIINVLDDGQGIPEGKFDKIFDRFYSSRPAAEGFGKHSGLGLSIAKQIVDAHKGKVYAGNRLNDHGQVQGAVFTVELPLIP